MANEIITTLHPDQDPTINLYPNVKKENIPNGSIDVSKISDDIKSLLNSINELKPSGTGTSTTILAFTKNNGIYIGTDTGNWYYWDGTHYVSGGVYQAVSFGVGEIKYYNTDFVKTGKNLFNKNNITSGKFIYYGDGNIYNNAQFWLSDYIDISDNNGYITISPTNGYQLCFFDNSKTYISGSYYGDGLGGVIPVPSNAVYIRYSDDVSRLNVSQVEFGQGATSYENYYLEFKYPKSSNRKIINITNNVNDFVTKMKQAYDEGNCDVYIAKGNYDISNTSLVTSVFSIYGIRIGNNNKYYFDEGSKIICNYTGSDIDILTTFSVFTSFQGNGSFELHNCTIECSNVRYAIHDENGGTNTDAYTHKFINCDIKYDNSNNPYVSNYNFAIGGGLGTYALIILENCIIRNMMTNAVDVSYHGNYDNTMTSGIQKVIVTGCYFNYRFQMANPNYETNNKTFIYSNNSSGVIVRVEDPTKVDSYIYNNNVRS